MGNDYSIFYTDNTTAASNTGTIAIEGDFASAVYTVTAEKKKTALDWLDERIEEICVKL